MDNQRFTYHLSINHKKAERKRYPVIFGQMPLNFDLLFEFSTVSRKLARIFFSFLYSTVNIRVEYNAFQKLCKSSAKVHP